MPSFRNFPSLRIAPGFCFFLALLLRALPLSWFASLLSAGIFHELCHLAAVYLLGGRCAGIRLGLGGAVIQTSALSPGSSILCALAGPAGGLLLIPLYPRMPELALCAAVQSIYNLLPLPASDGSTVLKILCAMRYSPAAARRIQDTLSLISGFCLIAAVLWVSCRCDQGFLSAIIVIPLISKLQAGKKPCKYIP